MTRFSVSERGNRFNHFNELVGIINYQLKRRGFFVEDESLQVERKTSSSDVIRRVRFRVNDVARGGVVEYKLTVYGDRPYDQGFIELSCATGDKKFSNPSTLVSNKEYEIEQLLRSLDYEAPLKKRFLKIPILNKLPARKGYSHKDQEELKWKAIRAKMQDLIDEPLTKYL